MCACWAELGVSYLKIARGPMRVYLFCRTCKCGERRYLLKDPMVVLPYETACSIRAALPGESVEFLVPGLLL